MDSFNDGASPSGEKRTLHVEVNLLASSVDWDYIDLIFSLRILLMELLKDGTPATIPDVHCLFPTKTEVRMSPQTPSTIGQQEYPKKGMLPYLSNAEKA
ncbi:hypothetical protein N7540_010857 [Penicillium herquei]|nr:hypothetical protein N7540_010857 [Penicillium herquei]